MWLPKKVHTRKEEITADFETLVEEHISDLVHNKAQKLYHARDFAALLFIHPRHLTNTIKLTKGKSPCEIMEERIMHEAQNLLLTTNIPVSEIAARFTYYNATNFIKFFRNMCGVTPLQYRKQHQPAMV